MKLSAHFNSQSGIIHIGLILLVVLIFVLAVTLSFDITRSVQNGQVASARSSRDTSLVDELVERGMDALGLSSESEPRPGSGTNEDTGIDVIALTYDGEQPTKSATKCPNHDDTVYHGVWDDKEGCYYDHTHGMDPSKTIFKDIVEKWGQEISYPWQTPSENQMKHNGYFYIYDEAKDGCEHQAIPPSSEGANCVTHILYKVHSMGTNTEVLARLHSFRVVARICDPDLKKCGFVETGGWSDYGVLHCPYKKAHCPLAVDPAPLAKDNGVLPDLVAINQPPYRTSVPLDSMDRILSSGQNTQFWNNQTVNPIVSAYYPEKYNVIFGGSWSFIDAWEAMDPNDVSAHHFICEDGNCEFNHTATQLFTARFTKLPNGPFNGFTDKKGNINTSCKEQSADCIPLIISGDVPSGEAWLARKVRQGDPEAAPIREYDVCFKNDSNEVTDCQKANDNAAGWIKPQMVGTSTMKMDGSSTY